MTNTWMSRFAFSLATLGLIAASSGCGKKLKAPSMQVDKLAVTSIRVTGAGLDVGFRVRNPNAETLEIERFEYELSLNGNKLGNGYHPSSFTLAGFDEAKVVTKFDVNFLRLPGTIKALLDGGDVEAMAKGTFYIKRGAKLSPLGFKSSATVPITK